MLRVVRIFIWNILALLVIAFVVEGVASYSLLVRDVMTTLPLAERLHTRYDPELGWVNIPSVFIPDVYGSGLYVRTNEAGFRNDRSFSPAVPAGMKRVLCTGDSFTFGWGVDNEHTWCQLLATEFGPGLETMNMGLGGYGIDQMYLAYKRDGLRFNHHAQVLAFITQDIVRMEWDTFSGYGKPMIAFENGALAVKNVPVPQQAYRMSWIYSHRDNLQRLRTWELISRVGKKLGGTSHVFNPSSDLPLEAQDARTRLVLTKIIEDLKHINEEHGSLLVLVYLPILEEVAGDDEPPWIAFVEKTARELGVPLINTLDAFRHLTGESLGRMYIRPGQVKFPGAAGHLTAEGNALVADVIHRAMQADPQIARALAIH